MQDIAVFAMQEVILVLLLNILPISHNSLLNSMKFTTKVGVS